MLSNEENEILTNEITTTKKETEDKTINYLNKYNKSNQIDSICNKELNTLLENEKQKQKSEQWNKIDKTTKIQLLHSFAEKYGNDNNLPAKEIKNLKMFFISCLNKEKLQKNKDVNYLRDSQQIVSIPALHFNSDKKCFTLKVVDNKRVSTLKSLTPKKNK